MEFLFTNATTKVIFVGSEISLILNLIDWCDQICYFWSCQCKDSFDWTFLVYSIMTEISSCASDQQQFGIWYESAV